MSLTIPLRPAFRQNADEQMTYFSNCVTERQLDARPRDSGRGSPAVENCSVMPSTHFSYPNCGVIGSVMSQCDVTTSVDAELSISLTTSPKAQRRKSPGYRSGRTLGHAAPERRAGWSGNRSALLRLGEDRHLCPSQLRRSTAVRPDGGQLADSRTERSAGRAYHGP
jgi:hypothetical protein